MAQNDFIEITLQGTTFKVPKSDTNPSWGEELSDYLVALGNSFATVVGPSDIQETVAPILNNQSTTSSITGLSFDSSTVRAAFIDYTVYRSTSLGVKKEVGTLQFLYDSSNSVGNKWSFTRETLSDSGVIISVDDTGQALYTSDSMSGTGYSGTLTYRARGILQS